MHVRRKGGAVFASASLMCAVLFVGAANATGGLTGAIFTTNAGCTGVNLNIYGDKGDVYLNGGPRQPGAAGLPDGRYHVKVTEPGGELLGTSVRLSADSSVPEPGVVEVSGGEFVKCYQLSSILTRASDATRGYDSSGNGVYKVWVSSSANFEPSLSKTDNFKVASEGEPPQTATLRAIKYYDADFDGIKDAGEGELTGWKVNIRNGIDVNRYTPVEMIVAPGSYEVGEYMPEETNWIASDAASVLPGFHAITLAADGARTVQFGNFCVRNFSGGRTIGFWSNKNGQVLVGSAESPSLALLRSLPLVQLNGAAFDPLTYAPYRTWLLNASSTNMAYMLSAQLSALSLNVQHGFIDGSALLYPSGKTVNQVIADAVALLTQSGGDLTTSGSLRAEQETVKNLIDSINNNAATFVPGSPCTYTFPE